MEPTIDLQTGVPFCSSDECKEYDGKRCRLLGCRPGSICEPAVVDLRSRLAAAEALLRDVERNHVVLPMSYGGTDLLNRIAAHLGDINNHLRGGGK